MKHLYRFLPADLRFGVAAAGLTFLLACGGGNDPMSPAGKSGPVTVTLPDSVSPSWMAYQDGDGAWKTLTGSHGTYTFQVTSEDGRYGVAVGLANPLNNGTTEYVAQVFQASRTEMKSLTYGGPSTHPATVSGTVTGIPAGEYTSAHLKLNGGMVSGGAFTIATDTGINDVFVKSGPSFDSPTRYYLQRGVNIAGDTTLATIDLASSGATPAQAPMAVTGLNGATGTFYLLYLSPNGTWPSLNYGNTAGSVTGYVLPAGMRASGDLYYLGAQEGTRFGYKVTNLSEATPTVDLPTAVVSNLQVSIVPNPTRGRLQWTAVAGTSFYTLWASQSQTAGTATCDVAATAGWLGGAATLQYTQPDFTGVTGFNLNWVFSTLATTDLQVVSYTYSDGWTPGNPNKTFKAGDACRYSWLDATVIPVAGIQQLLATPQPRRQPRDLRAPAMGKVE